MGSRSHERPIVAAAGATTPPFVALAPLAPLQPAAAGPVVGAVAGARNEGGGVLGRPEVADAKGGPVVAMHDPLFATGVGLQHISALLQFGGRWHARAVGSSTFASAATPAAAIAEALKK